MLTESKTQHNTPGIDTANGISSPRPRLVLKKSKTKLLKSLDRKSSLNRAEVARIIREICAEKGIEYPNK
jgi:hypothetical protein